MDLDSVLTTETRTTDRRRTTVATVVVLGVVLIVGCALILGARFGSSEVFAPTIESEEVQVNGTVLPASQPVRLTIPSIAVDTSFETPLGLKDNGEIEVPQTYTDVAFYKHGPTPGELGPSVILGHVDSREGPAVFFSLGQLKEGDEVKVEREDGSVAVFAVTELERHPQSGFPTRQVYGDIDHAGLRLITCTGLYERDVLRYTHNLIVFAKLVRTETVDQ